MLVFPTIKHLELLSELGSVEETLDDGARAPGGARACRRSPCATARRRSCCRANLATTTPSAATKRPYLVDASDEAAFLIAGDRGAALLSSLGAAAMADTLIGTDGPDQLPGTPAPDQIYGEGGDDVLTALGAQRLPRGGARQRRRSMPAAGSTWSIGGTGNDRRRRRSAATMSCTPAPATTSCSAAPGARHALRTGRRATSLFGGSGEDRIYASGGPDFVDARLRR